MSKHKRPPRIPLYPPNSAAPAGARSMRPITQDIRRGVRLGLGYGIGFSVLAAILHGLAAPRPLSQNGTSLGMAIAFYLIGGSLAGFIAGAFRRAAARSRVLLYVVGMIAAAPVAFGSTMIITHHSTGWGATEWASALILTVVYGVLGTRLFRDG